MTREERKRYITCIIHTNKMHHRVVEKLLNDTGVYKSQHHLLMYLSEHDGLSQKEIATAMDVSTATIAVTLKKLEREGYIEKVMDSEDNRFNKIRLSESGRRIVAKSFETFALIDQELLDGISLAELEQMETTLKKMQANLVEFAKRKGIQNIEKGTHEPKERKEKNR